MTQLRESTANKLLGYPADARLLIVNADDFGMCHAVNEAIFRTIKAGIVRSTSLMPPCPWATDAMRLLTENPDISFGVHLTLVTDNANYPYRPFTGKDKVPSLVNETGEFFHIEHIPDMLAQAKLAEVEIEFRAQIEKVLAANLKPAHLDWHCLHNAGRPDMLDLTFRLAREYGLALRIYEPAYVDNLAKQGLPADEYSLLDSYDVDPSSKAAQYAQLLRDLPIGLSEWAVHPGLDTEEMQAIEPGSWQVRHTDYDFFMSSEAQQIIQQEGIILLSYKDLQAIWQANAV